LETKTATTAAPTTHTSKKEKKKKKKETGTELTGRVNLGKK
jgi:hypothetical protein